MDGTEELIAFAAERLADDERFMQVLTEAGKRRAAAMTGKDLADMGGLMMEILSDPDARAELERWPDHGLMPPSESGRILAEITMKRAILERHRPEWADYADADGGEHSS